MTPAQFTPREIDVIRAAGRDQGQKEIARTLSMAPRTVSTHLSNIYRVLGIRGVGAGRRLTRWARENGYGDGV